ncbi:MAG: hypothetical protein MJ252_02920 [archaeon]|nr:hypothetical protein [archaeon]
MGNCGSSNDESGRRASRKGSFLEMNIEQGNEYQRAFCQRILTSYNSPIEIDYKIQDNLNMYAIYLYDMGNKYTIQNGGFMNTDDMLHSVLDQVYNILQKNRAGQGNNNK